MDKFDYEDDFGVDNGGMDDDSDSLFDTNISIPGSDDTASSSNIVYSDNIVAEVDAGSQDKANKKSIVKTAIIIIVVGIILVVLVFVCMNALKNSGKSKPSNQDTKPSASEHKDVKPDQGNSTVVQTDTPANNQTSGTLNWMEFGEASGIVFEAEPIKAIYTVTSIKHYASVVDAQETLAVKSVLEGNISGFTGTYSLDVPYDVGHQLSIGNSFAVSVQFGKYNEKRVIGKISY